MTRPATTQDAATDGRNTPANRPPITTQASVTDRQSKTGIHPSPVQQDGAGTALSAVTTLLCSSQAQMFAQKIEQSRSNIVQCDLVHFAVHDKIQSHSPAPLDFKTGRDWSTVRRQFLFYINDLNRSCPSMHLNWSGLPLLSSSTITRYSPALPVGIFIADQSLVARPDPFGPGTSRRTC